MKKSIFNIALLSMLFVLGACSTAGEGGGTDTGGDTIPGETGDPVIDAAIKDSLAQLGSVEGMDIWTDLRSSPEVKCTDILYISANKFKNILTVVYDGNGGVVEPENRITFDNEVGVKTAIEGNLTTSTDFKLFDSTGAEITDKKGYTTFYKQNPTKGGMWSSIKAGGSGNWTMYTAEQLNSSSYRIVKETDTELSMIRISLKTDGKPEDGYKISGTMDEEIADADNYTK